MFLRQFVAVGKVAETKARGGRESRRRRNLTDDINDECKRYEENIVLIAVDGVHRGRISIRIRPDGVLFGGTGIGLRTDVGSDLFSDRQKHDRSVVHGQPRSSGPLREGIA